MGSFKPKEPLLAVMLSIILTGLGQVYAGRAVRGAAFFSVPVSAIILAFLYIINPNTSLSAYELVPLAALYAFYTWEILDAYRCAKSYNVSNSLERKISGWKRAILVIGIILFVPFENFPLLIVGIPVYASYIRSNIVRSYVMPSGSMEPTLQIGDRFLVDTAIYKKSKPQRGDLIVFRYPPNPRRVFLKRLIALGGETVEIKEGHVYINGQLCLDTKIKDRHYINSGDYGWFNPVTVPKGSYYVLGDNSASSEDSRAFGFVPSVDALGKAYKIYWPLSRSGKVE